jgi:hypothetical protein
MTCGGNPNQLMGGRRRRTGRKQRGGNFYGVFGGDPQLGSAGARYDAIANPAVNSATGGEISDYAMPGGGRRRRRGASKKRLTRRGGRKSRRVMPRRKRTMRGGANSYNAAATGYGFSNPEGFTTSGPAPVTGYNPRAGPFPGGAPVDAAGVSIVS